MDEWLEIETQKLKRFWNSIVMSRQKKMNDETEVVISKSMLIFVSEDLNEKCIELYDLYARYWFMQGYNVVGIPVILDSEKSHLLDDLFFVDKDRAIDREDFDFERAMTEAQERLGNSDLTYKQIAPLASVGWPIKTQDFINLFPFDLCIYPEDKKDEINDIISSIYSLVETNPFKSILLVNDHTEIRFDNNSFFYNKVWNLSKFILHLPQMKKCLKSSEVSAGETDAKEATICLNSSRDDQRVYSKKFILSFKDEYVEPPEDGLSEIVVHISQKPVLNKWKSKTPSSKKVNWNETENPKPLIDKNNPINMKEQLRTFRGCLNKLTPDNFERVVPKMIPIFSEELVEKARDMVYTKIVMEPNFQDMYLNLCKKFQQVEPSFITKFFEKCKSEMEHEHKAEYVSEELQWKSRKQISGTVIFLTKLVNENVLELEHLKSLWFEWMKNHDYEYIGLSLKDLKKEKKHGFSLDHYQKIKEFSENKENPARIRFLIQDAIEDIDTENLKSWIKIVKKTEEKQVVKKKKEYLLNVWIKNCLYKTIVEVYEALNTFDVKKAKESLMQFYHKDFSDIYLEAVKPILYQNDVSRKQIECFHTLKWCLHKSIQVLHPFCPELSDNIFNKLNKFDDDEAEKQTLLTITLPIKPKDTDQNILNNFLQIREIIDFIKDERNYFKIPRKHCLSATIFCKNNNFRNLCFSYNDVIRSLCWCNEISIRQTGSGGKTKSITKSSSKEFEKCIVYLHFNSIDRKFIGRLKSRYPEKCSRIDSIFETPSTNSSNNSKHNNNKNAKYKSKYNSKSKNEGKYRFKRK